MSEIVIDELDEYLKEETKKKSVLHIASLKKKFPKDKSRIDRYKYVGILNVISPEYPNEVRACIYDKTET